MSRKTVTSMTNILQTARAFSSRAVGLFLILFIFYGTTVEAVHRHGEKLDTTKESSRGVDQSQANNLNNTRIGCNDCLICQLHHGFSTTLISVRSDVSPSTQRCDLTGSIPDSIKSAPTTTQSGRAPPRN